MATIKSAQSTNFTMDKFVPAIWSSRILKNLHDKQVLAQLCTTEYGSEIKGAGDTVKIHGVGAVTVTPYTLGTDLTYDALTDTEILVEVDAVDSFRFFVEDIELAQASPKFVSEASAEAAMAMAKASDNYLYNKFYTAAVNDTADGFGQRGASSATNGGLLTCDPSTAANVYNGLVDAGIRLDDLLCPEDGRFVVVPSFVKGALLKDDRFVAYNSAGQAQARDKGLLGEVAGFKVYTMPRSTFTGRWNTANTNAVADHGVVTGTTADDFGAIFGRVGSMAYVEQLNKVENIRLQNKFADAIRGLHVYGSGAIRPQHLGVIAYDDPAQADS